MHWSRGRSWTDHVAVNALITWLNMQWSRGWSCTDHMADHAQITWLIMHYSRCGSRTDHAADHTLIRGSTWTHHVSNHTLITLLIMHWTPTWKCTDHVTMIVAAPWPGEGPWGESCHQEPVSLEIAPAMSKQHRFWWNWKPPSKPFNQKLFLKYKSVPWHGFHDNRRETLSIFTSDNAHCRYSIPLKK